jgi:putative transport protein
MIVAVCHPSHVSQSTCAEDLDKAASALGNSLKELSATHFIPLFIGIILGVALGTVSIAWPGIPRPVR